MCRQHAVDKRAQPDDAAAMPILDLERADEIVDAGGGIAH